MKYLLLITSILILFSCAESETKDTLESVSEVNELEETEIIRSNIK